MLKFCLIIRQVRHKKQIFPTVPMLESPFEIIAGISVFFHKVEILRLATFAQNDIYSLCLLRMTFILAKNANRHAAALDKNKSKK